MKKFTCFIFCTPMQHAFSKESYQEYSKQSSIGKIIPALFFKCPKCVFVASKTHTVLDEFEPIITRIKQESQTQWLYGEYGSTDYWEC